eukprot:TRINITY_DN68065_c1_g1_i2.p1 TRINITY_DN68065_c1_g1~~TRINITY_DN68065_c1_g1_i2.p1  ORF type:complete len:1354 (+),score=444.08 TRINITY_DN68065_c1_g1_i2:608-4063(+)
MDAMFRSSTFQLDFITTDNGTQGASASEAGKAVWSIHEAVAQGDIQSIRNNLQFGGELVVDSRDKLSRTPLHVAIECGHIDIVDLLIDEYAADTSARLNGTSTCLWLACQSHCIPAIARFGSQVNDVVEDDTLGSKAHRTKVLEACVTRGWFDEATAVVRSNPSKIRIEGVSMFQAALDANRIDLFRAMMVCPRTLQHEGDLGRVLLDAATWPSVEAVHAVLDVPGATNVDLDYVVKAVVRGGHVEVLDVLLDFLQYVPEYVVKAARESVHPSVAQLLVNKYDIDDDALRRRSLSLRWVVDLLRLDASLATSQFSGFVKPLRLAAITWFDRRDEASFAQIMSAVQRVNGWRSDLVEMAVHRGRTALVVYLIESASADDRAALVCQALDGARQRSFSHMVRVLLYKYATWSDDLFDELIRHRLLDVFEWYMVACRRQDPRPELRTFLRAAISAGSVDLLSSLCDHHGVKLVISDDASIYHIGAYRVGKDSHLIPWLSARLGPGVFVGEPESNHEWPLMKAAVLGFHDGVLAMMNADREVLAQDVAQLERLCLHACQSGWLPVLRKALTIAAGALAVAPLVRVAAFSGHELIVWWLFRRYDIDLSVKMRGDNDLATTLLEASATHGMTEVADLVLQRSATNRSGEWMAAAVQRLFGAASDFRLTSMLIDKYGVHLTRHTIYTPSVLNHAAKTGYVSLVDTVMAHGGEAVLNTTDPSGDTALHLAARGGHSAVALALIERYGIDINRCGANGDTALHCAMRSKCRLLVHVILRRCSQALVNAANNDGETALSIALYQKDRDLVVELITKYKADFAALPRNEHALTHAAGYGWSDVVPLMLDHPNVPDDFVNVVPPSGGSALLAAIQSGHTETALLLIQRYNADVTVKWNGLTPLHEAADRANESIVRAIMATPHGAAMLEERNDMQRTPLLSAASCIRGAGVVKYLLTECKADATAQDANGQNVLHKAMARRWADVADIVLAQHPELVNVTDGHGRTPLLHACQASDPSAAVMLIRKYGADVNVSSNPPPIVMAMERGWSTLVDACVAAGANVNTQHNGAQLLILACRKRYRDVVKQLIKLGADPTSVDKHGGWNVLHFAAANNWRSVVDLLKDCGRLTPEMCSKVSDTGAPWTIARYAKHQSMADRLLELARS